MNPPNPSVPDPDADPSAEPDAEPAAGLDVDLDTLPLRYDDRGLLPVITQDAHSGDVLMLAYANREALERTVATGDAHYWSRSRNELWRKGATSGNTQAVVELRYDCDGDALLYRVRQTGPACHTGERSCFHRAAAGSDLPHVGATMALLERVVVDRLERLPEGSYVTRLHERGVGYVAQKVVEEAGETIVAALQGRTEELVGESADLLFHLTVLLRESGVALEDVTRELERRHRERSGE